MKRKHPRLPNGMGHIKYIGPGRTNPYAVLPPEYNMGEAAYSYKKALCYVPDWYTALAVLVSYKAGTYYPGKEIDIARQMTGEQDREMSDLAKMILADYRLIGAKKEDLAKARKHKFSDLYEAFTDQRFGEYATADYSKNTVAIYSQGYKHLSAISGRYIEDLTVDDLQAVVNRLADNLSRGTIKNALGVCSNVYSYAVARGYVPRSLVNSVKIPIKAKETKHSSAYTDEDLKKIWKAALEDDPIAIQVIEQVYTGFRISAMYDLKIDLEKQTVFGGVKTGQRTVPLHHAVIPFFLRQPKPPCVREAMVAKIHEMSRRLGLPDIYATHSARHTFKRLCDKYGVNPTACRIMMGHSLGKDVHDAVYTHWDVEDLRREIEKIVVICAD